VNLCGGEPTLYPELPDLVRALIARNRHVLCCTNALKLAETVFGIIPPSSHFFLMVHLDGLRETHDMVCRRPGVFDTAVAGIIEAKRRGYVVMLNTTVYAETRVEEVEDLCRLAKSLKADGILVSPGYEYGTAAERIFLSAEQISERFRRIRELAPRYKVNVTPTFLDFAAGLVDLPCAPWSTVNYGPGGWRAPCYLIGEKQYDDWETFWRETDWAYWESRSDKRCANCRMHSGFEHSAVESAMRTMAGKLRLARWTVSR
jgi:hopanoid biosynthesis associated radical SAM protein HpnH